MAKKTSDGAHRRRTIVIAAAVVVLAVAGALILLNRERQYDSSFDTRVIEPAYRGNGPSVLYDEGHLNTHTSAGGYKPFADLIRSDGYNVRVTRQPLSAQALSGVSVLIIVGARGTNDANDGPAFSDSETSAIDQWIRAGGSLLLVTDHWPYGSAVESLAQRFGVQMGNGLLEDPEHHEVRLGQSHLVFDSNNGLLRDHPIIRGRNSSEQIHRVLTFTGQSVLGPAAAVPFMALSDAAVERTPTIPQVERSGGDIRVRMEYGAPVSAKGRAQGIALELEKGRIVVLGEAGMLRAQRGQGGSRVGMNVPGYDNRQLALNIMRWLSRVP
jgi:hypothetical protein